MNSNSCLICDRYDDVVFYVNSFNSEAKYVLLLLTEVEPEDSDLLCFGCNGKLTISTSFFRMCSTSEKCLKRKANMLQEEQMLIKTKENILSEEFKSEKYEETEVELIDNWSESGTEDTQKHQTTDAETHNIEDISNIEILEEEEVAISSPVDSSSLEVIEAVYESPVKVQEETFREVEAIETCELEIIDDTKETPTAEKIIKPKTTFQTINSVICEMCGKSLTSKQTLRTHLVQQHGVIRNNVQRSLIKIKEGDIYSDAGFDDFTCSFCFETFQSIDQRGSHEETHSNESRPFKCFVCSMTFHKKSRLKEHYEKHQNNSYNCSVEGCDKVFKSKHGKWAHEYKHRAQQVICSTCGKVLSTNWALNLHIKTVHTELPLNHSCEICHKKFKTQKALYGHSLLHDPKNKKHECSICLKKFLTKSKLERHTRHHTGEKPFSCTHCQYRGTNNYNLKRHFITHGINMFDNSTKIGSKDENSMETAEERS